jgi:tetraacyldisaccharide 4'-kinase
MINKLQLLFFFGRPFGPLYGLAMKVREKMYAQGLFRQHFLPVPVISVGNLVLGGTGKTPAVQHLARLLLQNGHQPAIISRGYGGKAKAKANVVADGRKILLSAEEAGDEPSMLADSLPEVPVLTGTRRLHPCRLAMEDYNADVLVLDDGFQHLAIDRDVDIVLFDGTVLAGNNRIFPAGILRESLSALHRCHAFVMTGITEHNSEQAAQFGNFLKRQFKEKPVFFASLGNLKLQCPDNFGNERKTEGPFFAFCGIANPSRFLNSLNTLSIRQSGFLALPDHVRYHQEMMNDICRQALASGARQLVTTQKDFVKIKNLDSALPRHVVEISFQAENEFDRFVLNAIQKCKKSLYAHNKPNR